MLDNCYAEKKKIYLSFFVAYCIGLSISLFSTNTFPSIVNPQTYDMNFFLKVLFNNLTVFFILCSGCIFNKITTYLCIISNAYFLGANTFLIVSLNFSAFGIIAHGLFEYSVFFLAAILGLKKIEENTKNLKLTIKILTIGISLIILGALVETLVSPIIFIWLTPS